MRGDSDLLLSFSVRLRSSVTENNAPQAVEF
jgi:hypothetical protein